MNAAREVLRYQPVFTILSRMSALYSFIWAGLRFRGPGIAAARRADWSRFSSDACT